MKERDNVFFNFMPYRSLIALMYVNLRGKLSTSIKIQVFNLISYLLVPQYRSIISKYNPRSKNMHTNIRTYSHCIRNFI